MMFDEINKEAAALSERLTEWRRGFHRRPETAHREVETSAVLRAFFERLGLPVRTLVPAAALLAALAAAFLA